MLVEYRTISLLVPEIILVGLATWMYVGGTFTRSRSIWSLFAVVSYLIAAFALWQRSPGWEAADWVQTYATGPLLMDYFAHAFRWLALLLGVLFTLTAARRASQGLAGEFFGTLTLITVGMMLVASAGELILLFLALELISIPTYVLLFLGRRDRSSAEVTAKYFFLSILSSALLLYGFSFLYGIAGSTSLAGIREALAAESGLLPLAPIALVLIVAGLGFKIAAVPFHFYAPDVYEGTTNVNAGLLAVAPKLAGIVALVRLVDVALPVTAQFAWQAVIVISLLTMTLGNICALWQRNIRRLLAYSSIAHAGYMLIGLSVAAAGPADAPSWGIGGVAAMLVYLAVYIFASLGTFAALTYLGDDDRDVSGIDELAGLSRVRPVVAAAIAVFMFSLAGIPPLAGFWGKFALFSSAIGVASSSTATSSTSMWFAVLAIAGAINAAIAAAYYLRVIGVMYFRPQDLQTSLPARGGLGAWSAMAMCAVLVIAAGVLPGPLVQSAEMADSRVSSPSRAVHSISGPRGSYKSITASAADRNRKSHSGSSD